MLDFEFYSPTKFFFGKDKEREVGSICREFGYQKVLLHSGGSSAERSGLLGRVRKSLSEADISFVELGGVVSNPRLSLVRQGIDLARTEQVDLILAVGGGSVGDSAKAIGLGTPYEGDVWDFYAKRTSAKTHVPVATIISLAATGTEGSNSSVITNDEVTPWIKTGCNTDHNRPVFSILNPELTYTVPNYLKAAGATDIISHCLERYLTQTQDVDLTDRMIEAVVQAVLVAAPRALANAEDYGAHATLMWAGTVAHNNVLGVGREQDWASHQIEHQVSAYNDMAHGAGLAIVMPSFMQYTLQANIARYYQFATRIMGVPDDVYHKDTVAQEGLRRFRSFLADIGMPLRLEEVGVKYEDIPAIAQDVNRNNGEWVGFFQPLSIKDVEEILRLAF